MIDLDHFRDFNDTHGHPAGDEALRVFARAALTVLRDSDTLARYGGEEFVVAVRDADEEATAEVAERIRSAVEHSSVEVGLGRYGKFTASLGVAANGAARPRPLGAAQERGPRTVWSQAAGPQPGRAGSRSARQRAGSRRERGRLGEAGPSRQLTVNAP